MKSKIHTSLKLKTKNMCKKIILIVAGFFTITSVALAQKIGFVDTEYILNQIPEYKAAKSELDKTSADWQKEIETKYAEIDKLYKAYQAEQILLTDDLKKKRENEIINREKEAKDLQKQRFGVDGDLFKKRQELIKPIQDRVYTAVQKLAAEKLYDFILDKSAGITVIFADPKLDKSDDVLKQLGVK